MTGDLTGLTGPDRPVPSSLTAWAEAELGTSEPAPDAGATAAAIDAFYGRRPGTAARLYTALAGADPKVTWEAVIEAADEWDSADSAAYQARVEAGLEPADGEPGSYPTFDDDPARRGLNLPEPQTTAELAAEAELDSWGPEGPYASYSEWLADGRPEPEAGA